MQVWMFYTRRPKPCITRVSAFEYKTQTNHKKRILKYIFKYRQADRSNQVLQLCGPNQGAFERPHPTWRKLPGPMQQIYLCSEHKKRKRKEKIEPDEEDDLLLELEDIDEEEVIHWDDLNDSKMKHKGLMVNYCDQQLNYRT